MSDFRRVTESLSVSPQVTEADHACVCENCGAKIKKPCIIKRLLAKCQAKKAAYSAPVPATATATATASLRQPA